MVRLIAMVRAGLIDLARGEVTTFVLEEINLAIEHAAFNAGPFQATVVLPRSGRS